MRIFSGRLNALFRYAARTSLVRQAPTYLFLLGLGLFVVGCTPTGGTTPPATANSSSAEATPTPETLATANTTPVPQEDPVGNMVVEFLQARVSSDEEKIRELTCADQEKNIAVMVNSFKGQDASLRDVACTFDGTSKVTCTGEIVLVYDGEEQTKAPGAFTVVQEDGRWMWCGETR